MMLWNYRLKNRWSTSHCALFKSLFVFRNESALIQFTIIFLESSKWWQHRIFLWYRRETKAEKYIWLFKCKFPFAHFLICWFFVLFFIIFKLMIQFNQNNDPNIFNFVDNFEGRVQYFELISFFLVLLSSLVSRIFRNLEQFQLSEVTWAESLQEYFCIFFLTQKWIDDETN